MIDEPVDFTDDDGDRVAGWLIVNRSSGDRHGLLYYYVETGMKKIEAAITDDVVWRTTQWDINGKIVYQKFIHIGDREPRSLRFEDIEQKTSPPWWWSVQV